MNRDLRLSLGLAALLYASSSAMLSGCGGDVRPVNVKPAYVGAVTQISYDGSTDDLLTAGLGKTGLMGALPAFVDPAHPTPAELRRAAIYTNYRALLDMTAAGGYGTLYGPNVDASGAVTASEGKIAGTEYLAFSDDGTGQQNVTLMVQLPSTFDIANPCIITATSSGSRGIYGAISVGEWGLKRGCAVAYTDKGTGAAPHDLMSNTVPLIDGTRVTSAAADMSAQFRAPLSNSELADFNAASPNRFAFKHAHSQRNPEKDWGKFTLQAVEFAFYVINERFGAVHFLGNSRLRTFDADNTIVIASGASNGGGAGIAAAEQDTQGLIRGVAVSEPNIEMPVTTSISVRRGATTPVFGKTLIDFTSYANLFQSCASLSTSLTGTPFQSAYAASFGLLAGNRCASLKAAGLLTATTTATQADEALQKLRDYGWEAESNALHASLAGFEIAPSVTVTFANALARASVKDKLCGISFAATDAAGTITTIADTQLAQMFATGNGVPPQSTPNVQLINDNNPTGPLRALLSVSPSTGTADMYNDGALCLRNLLTGTDAASVALQTGLDETRRSGNLRGKPAIIVHGRSDALLPVNHTSRPYYALNKVVEGGASKLSYIEVTNAQHFDSFIGLPTVLPGYDSRYVPLHVYLNRALDAMYAHLKEGIALPASQVLRTVPRGGTDGAAPAITSANVPAFAATPSAADEIAFSDGVVNIPD